MKTTERAAYGSVAGASLASIAALDEHGSEGGRPWDDSLVSDAKPRRAAPVSSL